MQRQDSVYKHIHITMEINKSKFHGTVRKFRKLGKGKRTKKMTGGMLFGLIVFHKEKIARYLADKVLEKTSVSAYDKETQSLIKRGLIQIFERLQGSYKYIPITYKSSKGIETQQLHKVVNVKMQKTGTGSYRPDSKNTNNHMNELIAIINGFIDNLAKVSHCSSSDTTPTPTPASDKYKKPEYYKKSGDKYCVVYFFDKSTAVPVETVFQQLSSPDAGAFDSHRPKREKTERHNIARKFINLSNEYARALSYYMLYKSEQYTAATAQQYHRQQNYNPYHRNYYS